MGRLWRCGIGDGCEDGYGVYLVLEATGAHGSALAEQLYEPVARAVLRKDSKNRVAIRITAVDLMNRAVTAATM